MKEQSNHSSQQKRDSDEIDLIFLAKSIWNGRKTILKTIVICAILGITIALSSKKEYTASTTLIPQTSGSMSKLGGLSSLASLAGVNMSASQDEDGLSPQLYPEILQSVPFLLEIINTPFTFSEFDHPITLFQYHNEFGKKGLLHKIKKYTIGLPGVIMESTRKQSPTITDNILPGTIQLSKEQEALLNDLEKRIILTLSENDDYVELTAHFEEPILAAQVAQKAQQLLQQYITNFKIEKATAQMQFIKERYEEKKKEFEEAQDILANFRDKNKNVTNALAQTEQERLQNEYQLAYEVYSQLAQQLEQAQIKIKEDTPVFSIIKPITVPTQKSKPNRPLIVFIWLFLGGIIGIGLVFWKQFYIKLKTHWREV